MPDDAPDPRERNARLFDELADSYDASGVEFFGPIATGLVELLALSPGEQLADLGCGPGQVLLPAAAAVGAGGGATGIDVSAGMVGRARQRAAAAGLGQVEVAVGDAQAPSLPAAAFDVVASSLVLFFLADPAAALTAWRGLLRPGGRLGVSTFGPQDATWRAIDDLFLPYLPQQLLDARTAGATGPFASDAGMESLVVAAGFEQVCTVTMDLPVRFEDGCQWHAFSLSTGQRAMWAMVPEPERPPLRRRADELLAGAAGTDGASVLHQQVRYTLARAPG